MRPLPNRSPMIASASFRPDPGLQAGCFALPKRVVLIGHPVAQSLSGALQQAAFDELGIDARYEPLDVPLINLPDTIEELRGDDFLGANISFPHKERVAPMVDRLTEEAQATGAVDTITREGSRLIGHNTDVTGFRAALDALIGRQKMPKNAVIIGAGGGARAAVYTLITAGFQRVIVFNRHLHRAEGLVKHFGRSASHMELRAMTWHESVIEAELAKTKVLINASAVSDAADTIRPSPLSCLSPTCWSSISCTCRRRRSCCAMQVGRRGGNAERRHDACPPDGRGFQPVDRPGRSVGVRPEATRPGSQPASRGCGLCPDRDH